MPVSEIADHTSWGEVLAFRQACGMTQDLAFLLCLFLRINIASTGSMQRALCEESDATVREASVTRDEKGCEQRISQVESADSGKGHSSQPQPISKA